MMPNSMKIYFNSGGNLHKLHFLLSGFNLNDICYEWIDLYIYVIEFINEMYRQRLNSYMP